MRAKFNHYGLWAAALLAVCFAFGVAGQPPASAFWPAQDGAPITVTEKGCDFNFDHNDDREPDGSFDPDGDDYLPQATPVIAHCWFRVSVIVDATITVESELADWNAKAEIERVARRHTEEFTLNAGRSELAIKTGGHRVNIRLHGNTPRGSARNSLPEQYAHDLQVPHPFKLVNITVTTDAGDKEWVASHDVESASNAYIEADVAVNRAANTPNSTLPASVLALAQQLLREGYPEIAERVIALDFPVDAADGDDNGGIGLPIWAWAGIIAAIIIAVTGAVVIVIRWMRREPQLLDD